jgi:tetratricopeptide (TPR) repeat protein
VNQPLPSSEDSRAAGNAALAAGDWSGAISAFSRAVASDLTDLPALFALGAALCESRKLSQGIEIFRRAVAMRPDDPQTHFNLGLALVRTQDFAAALPCYRRAIELQPDFAEAHNGLGNALLGLARFDEATAAFARARDVTDASGNFDQAQDAARLALAIQPDNAEAHYNLGLMLLLKGDYPRGWTEYEWRHRVKEFAGEFNFNGPAWTGDDLAGRCILIHAEQGFGDALQFCRYLPMVAARGGKVVLLCHAHLHRLLANLPGVEQLVGYDQPIPHYDTYCHLASLPGLFQTTLNTIPSAIPYLRADETHLRHWRSRLPSDKRPKVGLVWAGRDRPYPDRSIPPQQLTPLANCRDIWWCSLQKQKAQKPPRLEMADWTEELNDFADTAALLANLDLVITIDSAVAHLAGAMGKPAFVLLKRSADWRWLLDRNDSPWYPTLRLFRQERPGDWDEPIERVVEALRSI